LKNAPFCPPLVNKNAPFCPLPSPNSKPLPMFPKDQKLSKNFLALRAN
jgi:hypothetical protein